VTNPDISDVGEKFLTGRPESYFEDSHRCLRPFVSAQAAAAGLGHSRGPGICAARELALKKASLTEAVYFVFIERYATKYTASVKLA